jgi:hypothetical protein
MMTNQNFRLVAGDDLTVQFTVSAQDGSVKNIGGAAILAEFRDITGALKLTKSSADPTQILITNAGAGLLEVYFVPADTGLLKPGDYYYDLRMTLAGDTITVAAGTMTVLPSQIPYTTAG